MSKFVDISSVKPERVYLSVYAEEPVLMYDKGKIDSLPAVDVQEVVRCRDCKYHDLCSIECAGTFGSSGFCCRGKRKDDKQK